MHLSHIMKKMRARSVVDLVRSEGALGIFFFQAEDGIRDKLVTGVQTCALPISRRLRRGGRDRPPVPDRRVSARGAGGACPGPLRRRERGGGVAGPARGWSRRPRSRR